MRVANKTGVPAVRPLFLEFAHDADRIFQAGEEANNGQFMFGPDVLVVPVTSFAQRIANVYLPQGVRWTHHFSKRVYSGGQWIQVDTSSLNTFPLFMRTPSKILS